MSIGTVRDVWGAAKPEPKKPTKRTAPPSAPDTMSAGMARKSLKRTFQRDWRSAGSMSMSTG